MNKDSHGQYLDIMPAYLLRKSKLSIHRLQERTKPRISQIQIRSVNHSGSIFSSTRSI